VAYLDDSLVEDGEDNSPKLQSRPNVFFEAGLAMGGWPERTILVECGKSNIPSDITGRHMVRLDNSPEKRQDLAKRLKTAGCAVDQDGTDWLQAGDLTPPTLSPLPRGRRLPSSPKALRPRLDATYQHGDGSISKIVITNHGPGSVHGIQLGCEEVPDLLSWGDDPVPDVLPQGKHFSVSVLETFQSQTPDFFHITVTAVTEDGVAFNDRLYVSKD